MADITYWDLKRGVSLNGGDRLVIYGIRYYVADNSPWYLKNLSGMNNAIFSLFGMSDVEKREWAQTFAKRGKIYGGAFPEFSNQQDLTDFVIAIYEKPLIKEGDTIIVRERNWGEDDYPYSYVMDMLKYQGQRVRITAIHPASEFQCIGKRCFNGDIHYYETEDNNYMWHSSMFLLNTLNKYLKEEIKTITFDSSMSYLVKDRPEVVSIDLCSKKEVSSEGIILNKPKKHFQTKIVL